MQLHGHHRSWLVLNLLVLLVLPAAALAGDWDDANRQFKQELTRYLAARSERGKALDRAADAQQKLDRATDRNGKTFGSQADLDKLRAILAESGQTELEKNREMDTAIRAAASALRGFATKDSVQAVAKMAKAVQEARHVSVAFGVLEEMDQVEALVEMAAQLETTRDTVFARYLARALWRSGNRGSRQAVVATLETREPAKLMGALDAIALADSGVPLERALELIEHKVWQVRVAALSLLGRSIGDENEERIVLAAIDRVGKEKMGRVLTDLHKLLSDRMGGAAGGEDPELWAQLWDNYKADRRNGVLDGGGGGEATVVTYYGVPIYSKYIVFVIDTSGSMDQPHNIVRAPKKEKKPEAVTTEDGSGSGKKKPSKKDKKERKELDWAKIKKKIDLAKAELIRTLEELDNDVHFSIVTYNTTCDVLSRKLVPATKSNKKKYIAAVAGLTANGGTDAFFRAQLAGMDTGLTGPKQGASKQGQRHTRGRDLGRAPDLKVIHANTIYFLTDGAPTIGGGGTIMPEDERQKNIEALQTRFDSTKVIINTVGIGPHDNSILQRIAQMTGGTYVDMSR